MGIDADGLTFLRYAASLGASFDRTCTIGRQHLAVRGMESDDGFADNVFQQLGAKELCALDYSDYEGAEILHDLNSADLPATDRRFSMVVDGGTLEHVFNVVNGIRSITSLVEVGGHVVFMNPADGWIGHGFYQFGHEFYCGALVPENGFQVELCLLKEVGKRRPWFSFPSPEEAGRRISYRARETALYYVLARRVSDVDFTVPALQFDYTKSWTNDEGGYLESRRKIDRLPQRLVPLAAAAIDKLQHFQGPTSQGLPKIDMSAFAPK